MWRTVLKSARTQLITPLVNSYTPSRKVPGSCTMQKRTPSMSSMTIVHSSRSRKLMVNRWALASRSALISFPRKNRTISLLPIVTLSTQFSNSWTTQAWQKIWDVAKPPNAHEVSYKVLRGCTGMNKLIQIARVARRPSEWAERPSTKSSVPQSLITSLMIERCLAPATINPNRPSWSPTLRIRCAHRQGKNVSQIMFLFAHFVVFL